MVLDDIFDVSSAWPSVNLVMLVQLWRKLLPVIEDDDFQVFLEKKSGLKYLPWCVL
jgi:hemolysin-activating ACP:hemolysin acyltransferase